MGVHRAGACAAESHLRVRHAQHHAAHHARRAGCAAHAPCSAHTAVYSRAVYFRLRARRQAAGSSAWHQNNMAAAKAKWQRAISAINARNKRWRNNIEKSATWRQAMAAIMAYGMARKLKNGGDQLALACSEISSSMAATAKSISVKQQQQYGSGRDDSNVRRGAGSGSSKAGAARPQRMATIISASVSAWRDSQQHNGGVSESVASKAAASKHLSK